mgnify:CR=1 FL=1
MKFEEMLLKRESCRKYLDKKVAVEDLVKIAEAGRLSPSGCNAQPWKFMIVNEEETLEKLRDALILSNGATGAPWRDQCSSYIVLIEQEAKLMQAALDHYHDSQRFAQGDLGMACLNMCYQAMELGLSTCILGLNDQKKMENGLGIPAGNEVRMVLAVGYSEDKEPRAKSRKPFDEVVCFNGWN